MATEKELIEKMRQQGRAYLKKNPKAFGGGIDPNTGIRYVDGKRVSVLTPEEEKAKALSVLKPASSLSIVPPQTSSITRPQQSKIKTSLGFDTNKLKTGADIITGGYFTERGLDKKESILASDIEVFNKQYGGRDLSEDEYKRALVLSNSLGQRKVDIQAERDKLASSMRSKIGNFFYRDFTNKRMTSTEKEKAYSKAQARAEKELKDIDKKLSQAVKKTGTLSKINVKRLKTLKKAKFEEITRLKNREPPKVYAGEFPIIPAYQIPAGVTTIKFIGTQKKAKGGKIITDIAFRTSSGKFGVAKGVSVAKGKKGASIVLGRSGTKAFKFPSGKAKVIDFESFIGIEKTLTKPSKLTLAKEIKLLNNAKKSGATLRVQKNIKALTQAGIGQVASVKGKKFVKAGKLAKGIKIDDFASVSAIFTKKQLSAIIGGAVTPTAKTRFIGLIKNTGSAKKVFTVGEKAQYKKAMQKVISATASALAKAEKTGNLPKTLSLAQAVKLATAKAEPTKTGKITAITKAKPKTTTKASPKPKTITKTPTTTKTKTTQATRTSSSSKSAQRTRQSPRTATTQKSRQKSRVRRKHVGRQKARQKRIQRSRPRTIQTQKAKLTVPRKPRVGMRPRTPRVPRIPIIKKKKKTTRKATKKRTSKKPAYHVYARPLKKTKGGKQPKLIRVNKVPLTKSRAQDLSSYIIDTSLSRTARIMKTSGKPQNPKLKVPVGYAKRTKNKFRKYKTVKGKRVKIPKGTIIEKRRNILDTRQEKKKITLRKRIRQLQKPTKRTRRSPVKRKPIKRTPTRKRTTKKKKR